MRREEAQVRAVRNIGRLMQKAESVTDIKIQGQNGRKKPRLICLPERVDISVKYC